jgi:hypothetical protein
MRPAILSLDNGPVIALIFRYRYSFPYRREYVRHEINRRTFLSFQETIKDRKARRMPND